MGRIQKHLPYAALALAAIALFVALGTTAIGAGGGAKATGASRAGGLAHTSLLNSVTTTTVNGPIRTIQPGQQFIGLRAVCPFGYRVTGGGAFSQSADVNSSINTSQPVSPSAWGVDYNNGTQVPIQVRAVARCIRFR
jgi:hypothetical protein